MMKNKLLILLVLGLATLLSGCLKEDTCSAPGGADGTLRMTLSIGDPEDVQTRSEALVGERTINNLVVLVFNGGGPGLYKDGEVVNIWRQLSGSNGDQLRTLTANLVPAPGDKLVVLVNVSDVNQINALSKGISTPDDINKYFSIVASAPVVPTQIDGRNLTMSGETTYMPNATTCRIYRSVAKIQLVLAPELSQPEYDITGSFADTSTIFWGMHFTLVPAKGAVYARENAPECVVKDNVTASDFISYPFSKVTYPNASGEFNFLYIPEYPSATKAGAETADPGTFHVNRTYMLVRTTAGYYRLDLYDHINKTHIDIRRNTHITMTIKQVKSAGYATAEEAMAAPGSNLEYEIKVTGDDDDIVVSNGQYALVLEYDELVICANLDTEFSLGKVFGVLPAGVNMPSTTTIIPSRGVILTGATSVSTTPQELKAKMNWEASTGGTITVRMGNIVKVIKLIRQDAFAIAGGTLTLMGHYSEVKWFNKNSAIWIRYNGTESMTILCDENVIPVNASQLTDRSVVPVFQEWALEGESLRAGSTPGRTKFILFQGVPACVGWFGGATTDNTANYTKRLLIDTNDAILEYQWSANTSLVTGVTNKETGLENTKALMAMSDSENYAAAHYCYMRNDRNNNGVIDGNESINWYLPSQNQMMAIWIVRSGTNLSFSGNFYWSSSEKQVSSSWFVFFGYGSTSTEFKAHKYSVRCVRDL